MLVHPDDVGGMHHGELQPCSLLFLELGLDGLLASHQNQFDIRVGAGKLQSPLNNHAWGVVAPHRVNSNLHLHSLNIFPAWLTFAV